MSKFNVTFNVLGSFTMGVEADDEDAAYDAATDAFFEGMDRSGIEYQIENRELELVEPSDAEDTDDDAFRRDNHGGWWFHPDDNIAFGPYESREEAEDDNR